MIILALLLQIYFVPAFPYYQLLSLFINNLNNYSNSLADTYTHMIRNKMPYLIGLKRNKRGGSYNPNINKNFMHQQPHWFQTYYSHKEILQRIQNNNKNIELLANQYQYNPTVYSLRQVERLITQNCEMIDEMDRWITNFQYSPLSRPGLRNTEQSIIKHFQMCLSHQILSVFNSRQLIASVNNQLDQQNNISFTNPHHNQSAISNSRSFFAGEVQDRNRLFEEVNFKIENLNIMLRRMNAVVAAQGDLINRIDQNLQTGQKNVENARNQLQKRADREEGRGEFSFQGKINQAITGLYIINLILIAIFFIKNVFF